MDLTKTAEYKEFGFQIVICPNCSNETLDSHYICPHCGWEYDDLPKEYSSCNKNIRMV